MHMYIGDGQSSSMEYYGLDIGVSSQQGRRPYQEDEFAVINVL